MIKLNIKLPVIFLFSFISFLEIDKMKCLQTCSRNLLRKLGGGGGISLLCNEDQPIFRGYILPDQPEFLVIFYKLFQLRQTHRIRNASFYRPYLGNVRQEIIRMIIKRHTYTHCTFNHI